jgi:hypothetical protein
LLGIIIHNYMLLITTYNISYFALPFLLAVIAQIFPRLPSQFTLKIGPTKWMEIPDIPCPSNHAPALSLPSFSPFTLHPPPHSHSSLMHLLSADHPIPILSSSSQFFLNFPPFMFISSLSLGSFASYNSPSTSMNFGIS